MVARDLSGLLLQLQHADQEAERLALRLQQIGAELADHSATRAARAAAEAAEAALLARRSEQQEREFELAQIETKLKSREVQLYAGRGNPRDLEALRIDVEHLRQQRGEAEEQVLMAMEAVEEARQLREGRRAQAEQVEAEAARTHRQLAAEQEQVRAQLTHDRTERDALAAQADPASLALYQRLRARLGGVAVAEVVQGRCTGCRITLPTTELQRARRALELVHCGTCGRILHVPH